ncbi:MAG: DUF3105 domain-containing protein [Dehalococcoidia bacterium]
MRLLVRALPNVIVIALIVSFGAINLVVYSGLVEGEDAVDVRAQAGATSRDEALERARMAEQDDSAGLPGRFVASQGIQHIQAGQRVEFCPPGLVTQTCYASNPPTSGLHLPVQRDIELPDGHRVNIPPDPGNYDFPIPREAIPHIQEHAGVYVGFNCASTACEDAVDEVERLVGQALEEGQRVVMSPDPDLDADTIALASWTRVDSFPASDYEQTRVGRFIEAHSCRFDPERFCGS